MEEFDDLVEITETLMGKDGCPWDAQQTLPSLQKYFLEEVYEVNEAIDEDSPEHILEELGDVFYLVLFAAKIAEKRSIFSLEDVLLQQKEKLVRRHPHVFSEDASSEKPSIEELEATWESIKAQEPERPPKKGGLSDLPRSMPLVLASQKILDKLTKSDDFSVLSAIEELEGSFQRKFFYLLREEILKGEMDAEGEIRRGMRRLEEAFEQREKIPPEKA